jgi:hypothetical protein
VRNRQTPRNTLHTFYITIFLLALWPALSQAAPGSLSVGFAGTHGSQGAFLDVTANQDLNITSFDLNLGTGSVDVTIYHKVGATTLADTTNSGAWTFYQTVSVTGAGQGTGTNVPITPFPIASGQTVAFFIASDTDGLLFNADGDGVTSGASDSAMTIFSAFEAHGIFTNSYEGWPWQGTVNYDTGFAPNVPIPTLSQWGVILLALMLGFIALRAGRSLRLK